MREIKFRAWDRKKKKWFDLSGELMNPLTGKIVMDEDNSCGDPECCGGPNPYFVDQKHIEVMQYTGLKDKNGKEIYEGDIVQRNKSIGSESQDISIIEYKEFIDCCVTGMGFHIPWIYDCRIIGNIYENPELLK